MAAPSPYDSICNWSNVFDGIEPDVGIVDDWIRAHSGRMTSWTAHIAQGLIADAWWALREEEERQELARAKAMALARGQST